VLERCQQGARELVARVGQAAGVEPPEEAGTTWLADLVAGTVAHAAAAEGQERQARAARDAAEAELERRRALAERVRRLRDAAHELTALAAKADERAAWRAELDAARRAVSVAEAERELAKANRLLDGARRAEAERRGDLAGDDVTSLRAAAGRLREEAGELAGLLGEAARQRSDRDRLAALYRDELAGARALAALDEQLSALPQQLASARAALDEASAAAAALPGLKSAMDDAIALAADAARLPVVQKEVRTAADKHRRAVDAHQRARETVLDVRARRLDGMAAELSAELVDGRPCPVCGSDSHPRPAWLELATVTAMDEHQATRAEQHALDVRQSSALLLKQAEQELTALADRLAGRSTREIGTLRRRAVTAHDGAASLAAQRKELASAVHEVESSAERVRQWHAERQRELAVLRGERSGLLERLAARTERLDAARGEHPDVASRRAHLLARAGALDTLAGAVAERVAATARVAEQSAAVREAVAAAGFVDLDAARAAVRAEPALAALRERLADAASREAAARRVLDDPDLSDVDVDTSVDLGTAVVAVREARAAAENAVAVARAAVRRAADVAGLAERLEAAWADLAPVEAEFAELSALTDVVNGRGQNTRRMSLRAYVLAAKLEEVAIAATSRLRRMSHGRFSFVHSDEAGPRGTRGGLGLDVLDDYSGAVRPAKTLSGGETFIASLALSLGLADVVAAQTGGSLLDTLFVDEGFGGLDAETLDEVMDTLDELRTGGRIVGLVSHVEELRQRIPVRLRVRKSRTGSVLELTA
jgi:exonuclease SbcC